MQTVAHGGHDAEVSTAAMQRPEQLLFSVVFGGNDAAVRENHVCGNYVVERQAKAADQRTIAAAQCESGHPDGADRAGHRHEAKWIGHRDNVRGAGAARDSRGATVGADDHFVHAAQVDDEPVAQGATGPVVATAAHRQREITVARGSNRRLHVLRCPAVDDGAGHAADWLCPERRCGDISIVTRLRNAARELSVEPAERPFNQTGH